MCGIKKSYVYIITIAILFIVPFISFSEIVAGPVKAVIPVQQKTQKTVSKESRQPQPALMITPSELKLGLITFDKSGEGTVTLKNTKSEMMTWSTRGPEGWLKHQEQQLSGVLEKEQGNIRVEVRLLPKELPDHETNRKSAYGDVEMTIEYGDKRLICTKELSVGTYKEEIKFNFNHEQKGIYVSFNIAYTQTSPAISLNPQRLDMGSILPGKSVTKKIILNNTGREMLKWSVSMPKHGTDDIAVLLKRGRYVSFANNEATGEIYNVPPSLKDIIKLTGKWTNSNGYPACEQGVNNIRINFMGAGIILYFAVYPEKGNLAISLNGTSLDKIELWEELKANSGELFVTDKLNFGAHVLDIYSKDTPLVLEGVRILGVATSFFPEGSMKIFPNSGATTRQSNYLTVSFNPGSMSPGYYADEILFATNGGDEIVETFVEILPENITKVIDIYRYYNGSDYLYTADPVSETSRIIQGRYVKEGIAFRLFKADTPGTKTFYRWYNPQTRSHFYHYIPTGGGKDLRGYISEGAIGNIATSKLTNTRELYRWYSPTTGRYFYSIDAQGGKLNKKIYKFDGIAGYVR
ncbi:MAG TPA: hypothetical protein PLV50_12950 [Smithella sp.]|nr:hypothetical protein [Smithella sp.]MDM7988629.1 hypothetical protein [Smithella sp.]HNY51317.1 hypothetical protein [Smithella sp.]HOG91443.1 hypothetical protein [Smithella sp.]HOU51370.1 hypothetical protein [Smithella sp.]